MISNADISKLIAGLQSQGKLPIGLSADQLAKLRQSLQKYSGQVSQKALTNILDDMEAKIKSAQSFTDPEEMRGAIADITASVGDVEIGRRIKKSLAITQEIASGGGQYLNQNLSPEAVDEFPALEFKRLFGRILPRGEKRGPKGEIIEVPEEAWPERWAAAGDACGDDKWLPWEGDDQTGRGVALKSSGIWFALGNGEGGFTDTLGNPFPPFAFNSGFMTLDLSRAETESLGLLDKGEEAQPAPVHLANLFAEVAA